MSVDIDNDTVDLRKKLAALEKEKEEVNRAILRIAELNEAQSLADNVAPGSLSTEDAQRVSYYLSLPRVTPGVRAKLQKLLEAFENQAEQERQRQETIANARRGMGQPSEAPKPKVPGSYWK
jgi:hypothetical protein